jgi:phosphate transport system permease protein
MKLNAKTTQKIIFSCMYLISLIILIPIFWVLFTVLKNGISVISWDFLSQNPQFNGNGGIYPAILGTLLLVIGTIAFSLPIGLGAAIYLSEYSSKNFLTRMIRIGIISLAGIPSIVYGLFGYAFFILFFSLEPYVIVGAMILALMILPVVITASREAIESVPDTFREVSSSLGASKWQTIRYAVLPYALPGILTGTILGIGRAAGETAPLLFIASSFATREPNFFSRFMALPNYLYTTANLGGNQMHNHNVPYGIAFVLISLVFIITLPAILIRARLRSKKHW